MELIRQYFPDLTEAQIKRFESLYPLYESWNNQINVISRKDFESLYEKHVLHSLAIAKFVEFKPGSRILDIGTGGGFPTIPLAILFENVEFTAVDSIAKKIKVVAEISKSLNLVNVNPVWSRVEEIKGPFDFIVSRAVATLSDLFAWTGSKLASTNFHEINNGLICLKGHELLNEKNNFLSANKKIKVTETPLSNYFHEDFFKTKSIYHVFKG